MKCHCQIPRVFLAAFLWFSKVFHTVLVSLGGGQSLSPSHMVPYKKLFCVYQDFVGCKGKDDEADVFLILEEFSS